MRASATNRCTRGPWTRRTSRNVRRWHRAAALRAKQAGFDLIYVYAGHGLSFLHHFLSREFNRRTDEYGGSLENRVRLLKELLIDTREAVGDTCAVPCRLSMDELRGAVGLEKAETEDMIGLVAEIPDLWDVCLASWENDSLSSRFGEEGGQEPFIAGVKKLTTKPVVGVGRYTSPDRMASIIRKGLVDLIGCARPSIADPFLPRKVAEGRLEDIRECIGCNICVSGDFTMSPIRCTQNPTMGEEWRRGWHPEFIRPKESDKPVLIIGRRCLPGSKRRRRSGKRGYDVTLAEQGRELGGRVARECRLPGLAAWGRVRDYRAEQLNKLPNVTVYLRVPARRGDRSRIRLSPRRDRDRRALAPRRGGAPPGIARADRRRRAGAHARRPHGRPAAAGTARASSGMTITTTWAA